jgi:hypothetical protein
MQAAEPVDDIVVDTHGDSDSRVFISAKQRSGPIALTARSPAFTETTDAFVRQFLKLPPSAHRGCRLLWAVPSSAGRATTNELPSVLQEYRDSAPTSLADFLHGRQKSKQQAFGALLQTANGAWRKHSGRAPTEDELGSFARSVFVEVYDFDAGHGLQREIEGEISTHIAADPKEARRVWEKLQHFFLRADCHGVPVNVVSLRKALTEDGVRLLSPPDYADDIERLVTLTAQNLARLKEHTTLPFGSKPNDTIHIPRDEELSALAEAVRSSSLLITGEPGSGKSGLVHGLVEKLQTERPVVLLLAEDLFDQDRTGASNIPGLDHPFDEVLANWPDGARGLLVTDALDAVRDVEPQKALRRLLRSVREGQSGWTVVASVREFDLKHSRELRQAFPGPGTLGHSSNDFVGVAHFHLSRLADQQLDLLAAVRPEIRPFIENALKSPKSGGIHRSPFHLRLAAELLSSGVAASTVADWHSPAKLLRKFWEIRVQEGAGASQRDVALRAVCQQMVQTLRMVVSLKQLRLAAPEQDQLNELRSRGILQAPAIRQGVQVGGDEIRFTHHLLHDYAIGRSLIPETSEPFCDFVLQQPLLSVFYRQSFMFALEELWDAQDGRNGFWQSALRLESAPKLHSLTRILAPILAARRVESPADLQPLLDAVNLETGPAGPAYKALLHLASGLQDTNEDLLRAGSDGWCAFAERLGALVEANPPIEWPLVHLLARSNAVHIAGNTSQALLLNTASRYLLANHISQPVSAGRQYLGRVAIETICRTFDSAPTESEEALLSLMAPERLSQFPHHDLNDLAFGLKHLGTGGKTVVLKLFEAAFASEPEPGKYERTPSKIMSMSFQTTDQWHMIHHALAEYYEGLSGEDAALMTEAACTAWNAVVRRRMGKHEKSESVLGTIHFRGRDCDLLQDYSHIWGRSFEYEENRILAHFEKVLRSWSEAGDLDRLNAALDSFAAHNRTSLLWSIFMDAGAAHPATLGGLLENLLNEPLFLTDPDYVYGGAALLGALHKSGDVGRREWLETIILELPKNASLHTDEPREPTPSWVQHAQDRLLNVLEEPNVVLESLRHLLRERKAARTLPPNPKPTGPQIISHKHSDEDLIKLRGIDLEEPPNREMFRLREALQPFLSRDKKPLDAQEIERNWDVILKCEDAVRDYASQHPKMTQDLWGHLVGACENIVGQVTSWPKTSQRWDTIRRILLRAANDPEPLPDQDENPADDSLPSWGWPAPRLDAARGLTFLAYRVGKADENVAAALRQLCCDDSYPVRFNLADTIWVLEKPASHLVWELVDIFVDNERMFSVLHALLASLNRLWPRAALKVKPRLQVIASRAANQAPAKHHLHEMLVQTYLFQFLRTGDMDCKTYISDLIAQCDEERASHALIPALHACRSGGWLTAGDAKKPEPDSSADSVRARTFGFFSELLKEAQTKVDQHREAWRQLHQRGQGDSESAKVVQERRDRAVHLVDGIAMQLYFASGAHDEKEKKDGNPTTFEQAQRFWREAAPLLASLSNEPHPHTAHQIVETLSYLLPCAPRDAFLLAAKTIIRSSEAGYQYESLAVGDVVKLIQRALVDCPDLFRSDSGQESECLAALLQVLDLFVEAGWAEARQLTHRLEEIYR